MSERDGNGIHLAPSSSLWDKWGTPRLPHRPCPRCGESDEVGSHCDSAWCCYCGWRGSLTGVWTSFRILPPPVVIGGD
jgi:hypothetical protein